jgi:hypothetical protein
MTATTLDTAMSGPPPIATRHDHQGVIGTSIERPGPEVVAACRSLYTGLVLDHLGNTAPSSAARRLRVWEQTGASALWPPISPSPVT